MEQNYEVRISKLETRVDSIEEKLDDVSDIKEAVTELTLLSRQQVERNKKFDELYEMVIVSNTEFSSTLKMIDKNLSCISDELKNTNERISNLEIKVSNIDNKSKVDFLNIIKQWLPKLIAGGLILYFLQLAEIVKIAK